MALKNGHKDQLFSRRREVQMRARPSHQSPQPANGTPVCLPDRGMLDQLRSLAHATQTLWRDLAIGSVPDPPNPSHSENVAQLGLVIAHALGLASEVCQRVYRAAYLHDVGSVAVPSTVLCKPGRLTPSEREAMQVHPLISRELLAAFLPTGDIAGIALSHHERYDGNGYPGGLQGTRIPIEARVLALADSLDGMLTRQPYRNALPFSSAWSEIIREAGRQFDPCIVENLACRKTTMRLMLGDELIR